MAAVRDDVDVEAGGLCRDEQSVLGVDPIAAPKMGHANVQQVRIARTRISPPDAVSDARMRASTICLRSRCSRRSKLAQRVEPPDKTMFCRKRE